MSTNHAQHTTIRFEQLMDAVRKTIRETVGNGPDPMSKLEVLSEDYLQKLAADGFTLPPKSFADWRQASQKLRQAPEQLAAQAYPTGHLQLWFQLECYRDYLTVTRGADEADRYLSELFGVFHRKRGRPVELLLATVMKAKKLLDAGKSYAKIGVLLHLTRQQVRSALRHYYPEKKPG